MNVMMKRPLPRMISGPNGGRITLLGDAAATPTPAAGGDSIVGTIILVAEVASIGLSGYHGYKRNKKSLVWGAVWAAAGAAFPVITPGVAVMQGFGKPKRR